jgi:Protein of unknown function (DUF2726)
MNTPTVIAFFIFALIVAVAIFSGYRRSSAVSAPWPFYLKRLLTQPGQVLYHRLVKALPNHMVLAQVQVSRVLGVNKGSRFHDWNNRISRLSYDFVICDKAAAVIAAIEVDDKSHEKESRRATDAKKSKATLETHLSHDEKLTCHSINPAFALGDSLISFMMPLQCAAPTRKTALSNAVWLRHRSMFSTMALSRP